MQSKLPHCYFYHHYHFHHSFQVCEEKCNACWKHRGMVVSMPSYWLKGIYISWISFCLCCIRIKLLESFSRERGMNLSELSSIWKKTKVSDLIFLSNHFYKVLQGVFIFLAECDKRSNMCLKHHRKRSNQFFFKTIFSCVSQSNNQKPFRKLTVGQTALQIFPICS